MTNYKHRLFKIGGVPVVVLLACATVGLAIWFYSFSGTATGSSESTPLISFIDNLEQNVLISGMSEQLGYFGNVQVLNGNGVPVQVKLDAEMVLVDKVDSCTLDSNNYELRCWKLNPEVSIECEDYASSGNMLIGAGGGEKYNFRVWKNELACPVESITVSVAIEEYLG